MGYSHQNSKGKTYFLHSKDVVLKGGRNQTIYYFAKENLEFKRLEKQFQETQQHYNQLLVKLFQVAS